MLPPKLAPRSRAFTLVELLTVIAIIAVLMGILFPTIGSAIESAKKVQAKNDEQAIVTAIKAYYTEYGKYPIETSGKDIIYGGSGAGKEKDLMNTLRYPAGTADGSVAATLNPRKITFLEVPDAKNLGKAGKEKEGISSITGYWLDPWGNEYQIEIDGDYDNSLPNPYGAGKNAGSDPLSLGVAVWSIGKNATKATDLKGSDDVISWQ